MSFNHSDVTLTVVRKPSGVNAGLLTFFKHTVDIDNHNHYIDFTEDGKELLARLFLNGLQKPIAIRFHFDGKVDELPNDDDFLHQVNETNNRLDRAYALSVILSELVKVSDRGKFHFPGFPPTGEPVWNPVVVSPQMTAVIHKIGRCIRPLASISA